MGFLRAVFPQYSGPFAVGIVDVEAPCDGRIVHPATFRSKPLDRPAFELDTVLFTLYYPAFRSRCRDFGSSTTFQPTRPKHHAWVPKRELSVRAEGFARFCGIDKIPFVQRLFRWLLWTMVGNTRIPAEVDVPLRDPNGSEDAERIRTHQTTDSTDKLESEITEGHKYPVLVLTHGMCACRTDYTHYCGELASRGYVVAAIEHRDGSCPGTIVHTSELSLDGARDGSDLRDPFSEDDEDEVVTGERHSLRMSWTTTAASINNGKISKPGAWKKVLPIKPRHVRHDPPLDLPSLQQAQLEFREAEIQETIRVLGTLDRGQGDTIYQTNLRGEGVHFSGWRGRLDMDHIILVGHSFGATGALRACRGAPSPALPLAGCIALDPGKSSGPLNDRVTVPLLVIHSHSWSKKISIFMGRPHFTVVKELSEQAALTNGGRSWFLTSLGTTHASVTDAPILAPLLLSWTTGATINVHDGVMQYVRRTTEFVDFVMTRRRKGLLAEGLTHPYYMDDVRGTWRRETMPEDFERFWQVHVAPVTESGVP